MVQQGPNLATLATVLSDGQPLARLTRVDTSGQTRSQHHGPSGRRARHTRGFAALFDANGHAENHHDAGSDSAASDLDGQPDAKQSARRFPFAGIDRIRS